MIYHDVIQGEESWFELRKGVPTASAFDRIITPVAGKLSKSADKYIHELIGETMSLIPEEGIENATNRAMRWGQYCEAEARKFYEMERRIEVSNGGFCKTDDGRFGASPDGLIGLNGSKAAGALELKAPQPGTQVEYVLAGTLPDAYKCQVHGHLVVTGAEWVDFLSYSPGLPALLIRVQPDHFTQLLREALDQFHDRLVAMRKIIQGGPS